MLKKQNEKDVQILKNIIKLQNIYFNINVMLMFYVKYNINVILKNTT